MSVAEMPPGLLANACDCHMHVYDPRFAASPHWKKQPPVATVESYRQLQGKTGLARAVVVTPSTYGVDNECTLAALSVLGDDARGIAVVDSDVSSDELHRLADHGVTGLRVNFVTPQSWGTTTPDMLTKLAARAAALGWHIQVLMFADQIVRHREVLRTLPVPVVFDHFARIPQPLGIRHHAFEIVADLMVKGRAYVKLSAPYLDTVTGGPDYLDVAHVAKAFIAVSPSHVLWGSDWPHPTEESKPDDEALFKLLPRWDADRMTIEKILVHNPAKLYRFR